MKKFASLFLALALVAALLAGCGGGTSSSAAPSTPAESTAAESTPASEADASGSEAAGEGKAAADITVAGVVFQEDQFMKLMQMGYEAAAADLGVNLMVSNTNNDQAKEAELINTYISQKIDGIAIAPLNETSSMQSLKTAYDSGLEIAVGNTKLADAAFVCGGYTSDNYMLGQQTGEKAKAFIEEKLDGKARVAVVQFKSQLPVQSEDRMNGFLDQLKDMEGVEVVADQDAWLQDQAVQVVGDLLTANEASGGIDIIWAANDGGTIGSVMAVKNAGKAGSTFVFGTDAAEQQVEMIRSEDDILQCVTGQDPFTIGYNTMEVLIKAVMGEKGEYGKEVIVPGIVLSRDDMAGVDAFMTDLTEKTQ